MYAVQVAKYLSIGYECASGHERDRRGVKERGRERGRVRGKEGMRERERQDRETRRRRRGGAAATNDKDTRGITLTHY